jgi:molybdopterin-containing oxidoreductase family iron-sulfur binding subunit
VLRGTEPATWGEFQAEIAALRDRVLPQGGAGIGIVVGPNTSPTLQRLFADLAAQMPQLRFYLGDPLAGTPQIPSVLPHVENARVIVSLGADFLGEGPGRLAAARSFIANRKVRKSGPKTMSRLYCLEPVASLTGANADSHMLVRPSAMDDAVAQLATAIETGAHDNAFFAAIARDVAAAGTDVLFLAGPRESAFVHATAQSLNQRAGATGRTQSVIAPIPTAPAGAASLYDLADDIDAGRTTTLFVLDCDLVFAAPGDLDLSGALEKLEHLYHYGLHIDETARKADWHVPATHDLESWGDLRAFDGTASIVQPLIAPLYQGRTITEIVAALTGDFVSSSLELVRASWPQRDDNAWRQALKSGVLDNTAAAPAAMQASRPAANPAAPQASDYDVILTPDPYLDGGAHAANLFLTELPRPLTKLVWGNAAEMAPATAEALGVATGDLVEITVEKLTLILPAFISPGQAPETVVVPLGFGRRTSEDTDTVGTNAYPLRRRGADWLLAGAGVRKGEGGGRIITTQVHHAMEGRDIVREIPLTALAATERQEEELPTLYPPYDNPEEAWGMSIDLNACIGCNACVAACQAENNSPVVGPDEMARGHDMHWLRVDRYYSGEPEAPETLFQPVPCMHCEDAPCEVVCPVNATVHTHDGLNAQVYNRCVGTRYCSQNCPYKVRRFNFFQYQDFDEGSPLSLLMNPNVSVRERGVMEKCTYCVQRISAARIGSEISDEPIADGIVQTACQQACPTRAITFGNINDRKSAVVREKAEPHSYAMLEELGTRPRTTYLARVTNRPDDGDGNA